MSLIDDFNVLELSTNATEQEAKAAYRRLARRYHPDKNPDRDTTEHFQRIHDAYQNVLQAIKRSSDQSWQPYSFTEQAKPSASSGTTYEFKSDAKQEAYVKQQQRAYQEMKRNNAQQDRAREEALNSARNTLHERRMKALYEEMRKADANKRHQDYTETTDNMGSEPSFDDVFSAYQQASQPSYSSEAQTNNRKPNIKSFRLQAAKAAFVACSYLVVFVGGIYTSNYWNSLQNTVFDSPSNDYISGLYPQYRSGTNYSLSEARLFTEPSVASEIKDYIPSMTNVEVMKAEGDWLTLSFGNSTGWAKAELFGFGSVENAVNTGCVGQPGLAPSHGAVIGEAAGNSRLRILNQLPQASKLIFESLDGQTPFSIYLQGGQPLAANFIPRGRYRLVLETGSLYHSACQRFLFNDGSRVLLDSVTFASTEQTLTIRNPINP